MPVVLATDSLDIGYRRLRTRQRVHIDPPSVAVPDINEDADEHKHILNVFARHRYRKKGAEGRATFDDTGSDISQFKTGSSNDESSTSRLDKNTSPSTTSEDEIHAHQALEQALAIKPINLDMESALDLDLQSSWPSASLESMFPNLSFGTEER
ncbi:hypothetical protein F5X96DRAFT_666737 [Biscogniauxia mediterranea]|nr:hypothetical protein F5X96DRAFT_666737 [Biscogniauxia mediterranea]